MSVCPKKNGLGEAFAVVFVIAFVCVLVFLS